MSERIDIGLEEFLRFQQAAIEYGRTEVSRLVQSSIDELRSREPFGSFDDIAVRHLWDEYCWAGTEGRPSLADAYTELVRGLIASEVEKLPRYGQIFVSALAFDESSSTDEEASLGSIWIAGAVDLVHVGVNERASLRNLDLIGPLRSIVIENHLEGSGIVWSALGRETATGIIASHTDLMTDPEADISVIADELLDTFMSLARDETEESVLAGFLESFACEVRSLLRDTDVTPLLEKGRTALLALLDGEECS